MALSRYGGLRCPSEVLSLCWQDVDWEADRIIVQSPKTEHHPGKANRTIPLFSELRPILAEAFHLAPDGAEFVVDGNYRKSANTQSGLRNCNLRTQFERLLKRAGLQPWPRRFHAMRASRETELAKLYPIHVVTSWLGNTPRIALKHYLQVTDTDFEKASQSGAECGAAKAQKAAQHALVENRKASQNDGAKAYKCSTFAILNESQLLAAKGLSGEDRNLKTSLYLLVSKDLWKVADTLQDTLTDAENLTILGRFACKITSNSTKNRANGQAVSSRVTSSGNDPPYPRLLPLIVGTRFVVAHQEMCTHLHPFSTVFSTSISQKVEAVVENGCTWVQSDGNTCAGSVLR